MEISGIKVKALRDKAGKSAAKVAAAIEMSDVWVYNMEKKDKAEVKSLTAHALARVLGVKITDIQA